MKPNKIIDTGVFETKLPCNKKDVFKEKDKKSIALSKSKFANYIAKEQNPFHDFSTECFSLIFDLVAEICSKPVYIVKDNAREISHGVYLEQLDNGFKELSLEGAMERSKAMKLKGNAFYYYNLDVADSNDCVYLSLFSGDNESLGSFLIPVNNDFIDFLADKLANKYNRIYLHLYDENKVHVTRFEIMADDSATFFIDRVLEKLKQK